jgi:hypothetical protein
LLEPGDATFPEEAPHEHLSARIRECVLVRILDFPLWLRAAHFFNFLLLSLLIRSGLEILSAHPRFYWNDHCTPGSEWVKFTKKQRAEE